MLGAVLFKGGVNGGGVNNVGGDGMSSLEDGGWVAFGGGLKIGCGLITGEGL